MLSATFECDARPAKSAACKPTSIGRLRASGLETRVNTGLAGRQAGNPRKHWASGQGLRRCPFYAGFRAGYCSGCYGGCCGESAAAGNGDSDGNVFSPHDRWRAGSRPEVLVNRAFAGRPETRVNIGLAGRGFGDAHFTRGSGPGTVAGVMVGAVVSLRPPAVVIWLAMLSSRAVGSAKQRTVEAPAAEGMLRSRAAGGARKSLERVHSLCCKVSL